MNTIELTQKMHRTTPISNGVLGMVLLIITEIMFFAGLISAYLVNRAGVPLWPPYDQPRLPVEVTAINTIILILSGVLFIIFRNTYIKKGNKSLVWLLFSMILALIFVAIQGYEWINLIGFGLTSTSSIYGAFFYTIIGMHAFHIFIGFAFLIYLGISLKKDKTIETGLKKINAVSIFWYFVILIWPVLYYLVYLY